MGNLFHALANLEQVATSDLPPEVQAQVLILANQVAHSQLAKGMKITSPDDARDAVQTLLQLKQEEVMAVLFLDAKHRIIEFEEMFH